MLSQTLDIALDGDAQTASAAEARRDGVTVARLTFDEHRQIATVDFTSNALPYDTEAVLQLAANHANQHLVRRPVRSGQSELIDLAARKPYDGDGEKWMLLLDFAFLQPAVIGYSTRELRSQLTKAGVAITHADRTA